MDTNSLIMGMGANYQAQRKLARLKPQKYAPNKVKTTVANIQAAIVGYVKMGATINQIVKLSGVSALDVEAVIINQKLSVKPN